MENKRPEGIFKLMVGSFSNKNARDQSSYQGRQSPDNASHHYSSNNHETDYHLMYIKDSKVERNIEAKQMLVMNQKMSKLK